MLWQCEDSLDGDPIRNHCMTFNMNRIKVGHFKIEFVKIFTQMMCTN